MINDLHEKKPSATKDLPSTRYHKIVHSCIHDEVVNYGLIHATNIIMSLFMCINLYCKMENIGNGWDFA